MHNEIADLCAAIEAMLFVSGDPVDLDRMAAAIPAEKQAVAEGVEALKQRYAQQKSGLRIRNVDGKVQFCTNEEYAPVVERLLQPVRTKNFSQSVIETLSIIAYKQPVTRAEIEAVRGVRCEYAINQLLQSGLIEETGRKDTVGRPALFGTTEKFLIRFGLENISQLPRREEILHGESQEKFDAGI